MHAGAGPTLAAARAPRYLETDAGRLGLVSMTTSPASGLAPALDAFGEVPARPGVHTVPVRTTVVVTRKVMRSLVAIREAHPEGDVAWLRQHVDPDADPPPVLELYGRRFELGEEMGVRHEPDEEALAAGLRAVRLAAQHADVVSRRRTRTRVTVARRSHPSSSVKWAHAAIDHGADMVAVSGPHHVAPWSCMRGRPIFYGSGTSSGATCRSRSSATTTTRAAICCAIGSATRRRPTDADLMGMLTEDSFGDDAVFRSVMARVRLGPDGLDEVRLHPVDLGRGEPLTRRGIPRTPTPEVAQSILEAIGSMSERFGVSVVLDEGTGLVRGV